MWKSFKIGALYGIPIYLHWSFLLLPLLVLFRNGWEFSSNIAWEIALILSLFFCVLLHELGHALSARRYGVNTLDIILSVIGGVARLTKIPEKPWHEFVVASAGPLVNVVIAVILSFLLWITGNFYLPEIGGIHAGNFIHYLTITNLVLVVFNLIPAFPMDGGRMLRSLLAMRIGRTKATRIAMLVGQVIAVGFGILGVYTGDFMLLFIGVFVFMSARSEYRAIQHEDFFGEHTVAEAMRTHFKVFNGEETIDQAAHIMMETGQRHFPILKLMQFEGILTHESLLNALADKDLDAPVHNYITRDISLISSDVKIKDAYEIMEENGFKILPVVEGNLLVGLLDTENLQEFITVQNAINT